MAVDKILQPASLLFAAAVRSPNQCKMSGSSCGHLLPLNITELQVAGFAHVTSIKPCPRIASGEGSVVTARFITREVNSIVRAEIEGPDGKIEVIEGTPIHPIWSVDRDDWVPLGNLVEGETLHSSRGIAKVSSLSLVTCSLPVYNIEVYGEHVYQIGMHQLMVHNAQGPVCGHTYFAQVGQLMHKRYMDEIADQVTKIKEFHLPSGRRIDFIDIENGFVYELKPNNVRAIAKGMSQLRQYIDELGRMPEFSHITNWKGILDVY
jgi:hypothetical protein